MKKYLVILSLWLPFLTNAQTAEVIKFGRLQSIIEKQDTQIQVINFWATWCAPCVKELPLFEALESTHDPALKITLVNLDYADKIKKVNAFVSKNKMHSKVVLLDEPDYNSWIDKVDTTWSGAIPATLLINSKTGERKFIEKELKEGELQKLIVEIKK